MIFIRTNIIIVEDLLKLIRIVVITNFWKKLVQKVFYKMFYCFKNAKNQFYWNFETNLKKYSYEKKLPLNFSKKKLTKKFY